MTPSRGWRSTDSSTACGLARHLDAAAVLALVVLTAVVAAGVLRGGTVVGLDSLSQFYPWYAFLRAGDVPGWNPYQFSGTPFAADPLSGWTYLPAMILFTLFPVPTAVRGYLFLHPLIAALSTYALGRTLGMSVAGALLAAISYGFSGYLLANNTCCFAYASLATWLPLAIVGAELALRAGRWPTRGLGWGVSGLALSQILASWLGQGSYYALLALGGYLAYRTLLDPPDAPRRPIRSRPAWLALHGGGVLLFGFGLAAAGLVPRVEYNALSNLAGGYRGPDAAVGGWSVRY